MVIYSQEGVFAPSGIQSLQILPSPPALTDEPWLTAVGQAYFVQPEAGNAISRTIAVTYLQRDVPEGYEYTLTLYFLPQKDKSWRRLRTRQFVENLLVADLQSVAGTYAVMATVVLPELKPGLNLFTYPLSDSRPVTEALTSIHSHYAEIYEVLPNGHLESAVDKLIFGHIYAIRIEGNQSVTLYLAPPRRLPSGVVPGSQ